MRRFLSLLLVLLMIFSIAACTSEGVTTTQQEESTTTQSTQSEQSNDNTSVTDGNTESSATDITVTTEETGFVRLTEDGTLTVGTTDTVYGFEPGASNNNLGMPLVYEYMIARNKETGLYEPMLCESFELTDPTTLVFHLRDNVYFSNGDKFVAEDVIWSFYNMYYGGARTASYYEYIDFDNSYCEDELTAVFKFKYEYGPWESVFGSTAVTSKSVSAAMTEEDYWDNPVGTGPYSVVENVSGSHTTYALRDDYWNTEAIPEAKTITVRSYSDAATMFIDFENGVLDIVTNIATSDVERLVSGAVTDCTYAIQSLPDNILIAFNNNNEYLQNENVRAAICYGVDYAAVGEAAKGVMFKEATSALPSDLMYYSNVGQYEYNPELAQQYMDASGYAPGEISLRFIVVNNGVNNIIAECVQAYLADVGINVIVEAYDQATAVGYYREGSTDLCTKELPTGVADGDPATFFSTMKRGSTNICVVMHDEAFQEILDEATYTSDTATRAAAYAEAQQWLVDNYWNPAVCEVCACYAYRNYIDFVDGVTPLKLSLRYVSFAD